MKKFVWILSISILLSACSINNNNTNKEILDFSINEESENFELEFEETLIEKVDTDLSITNIPKKIARFTDYDLWFSFLYPDNDSIVENKIDNLITIQNHQNGDELLKPKDFNIQIIYYPEDNSCENIIPEISSVYELNWITINRGYLWPKLGLTTHILCFTKSWKVIKISYIEKWNYYVNTIFNSLQFQ